MMNLFLRLFANKSEFSWRIRRYVESQFLLDMIRSGHKYISLQHKEIEHSFVLDPCGVEKALYSICMDYLIIPINDLFWVIDKHYHYHVYIRVYGTH
ncbi:hypothetical protein AMTRI_Chr07g77530 [Amborella trichopoda]